MGKDQSQSPINREEQKTSPTDSPPNNSLWKRLQGQGVRAILVRSASGAFVVYIAGTALALAVQIFLARILGAKSYGEYFYAITWMHLLVIAGKLGFDAASLRFVAEYNSLHKWGLLKGFLIRSNQIVLTLSVLTATTLALFVWLVQDKIDPNLATTFWVVCLILPLQSLLMIRRSSLRALKKVILALLPLRIFRPLLLISGIFLVYYKFGIQLNATTAMLLNLAAIAGVLIFVSIFLHRTLPESTRQVKPLYQTYNWLSVATPMLFINIFIQFQNKMDILLVGLFLESDEIGIYGAAKNITNLLAFGLISVNLIVTPMIAELYAQKKQEELKRMVNYASKGILAITLPLSLLLIIFGKFVLSFFGPEFVDCYLPMVILIIGQIIYASLGALGHLIMMMTNHQRNALSIIFVITVLNIILNATLIPSFGLIGASISTTLTLTFWSIMVFVYVRKYLRINPTVFI